MRLGPRTVHLPDSVQFVNCHRDPFVQESTPDLPERGVPVIAVLNSACAQHRTRVYSARKRLNRAQGPLTGTRGKSFMVRFFPFRMAPPASLVLSEAVSCLLTITMLDEGKTGQGFGEFFMSSGSHSHFRWG